MTWCRDGKKNIGKLLNARIKEVGIKKAEIGRRTKKTRQAIEYDLNIKLDRNWTETELNKYLEILKVRDMSKYIEEIYEKGR